MAHQQFQCDNDTTTSHRDHRPRARVFSGSSCHRASVFWNWFWILSARDFGAFAPLREFFGEAGGKYHAKAPRREVRTTKLRRLHPGC
jgi:hypothetical protein